MEQKQKEEEVKESVMWSHTKAFGQQLHGQFYILFHL